MTGMQDPPTPSVAELNQDEEILIPSVPVTIGEIVNVRNVPNKRGVVTIEHVTTTAVKVLDASTKRAVATLVCASDILLHNSGTGTGAYWPADTPLTITSTSELWASVSTSEADITVYIESWAD